MSSTENDSCPDDQYISEEKRILKEKLMNERKRMTDKRVEKKAKQKSKKNNDDEELVTFSAATLDSKIVVEKCAPITIKISKKCTISEAVGMLKDTFKRSIPDFVDSYSNYRIGLPKTLSILCLNDDDRLLNVKTTSNKYLFVKCSTKHDYQVEVVRKREEAKRKRKVMQALKEVEEEEEEERSERQMLGLDLSKVTTPTDTNLHNYSAKYRRLPKNYELEDSITTVTKVWKTPESIKHQIFTIEDEFPILKTTSVEHLSTTEQEADDGWIQCIKYAPEIDGESVTYKQSVIFVKFFDFIGCGAFREAVKCKIKDCSENDFVSKSYLDGDHDTLCQHKSECQTMVVASFIAK